MAIRTELRFIREQRGMPAARLAEAAGVSRQTIYAIEDGSFVPNTAVALRLARALEVTVEQLFPMDEEEDVRPIGAEVLSDEGMTEGQPVRLCRVKDRVMAVPTASVSAYLPAADGVVIESRSKHRVAVKSEGLPDDGKRLLLAGCDPALSLLGNALYGSGIEVVGVPCSSRRALQWLRQNRVHAAGSHLLDRESGEYNLPIIRRLLPDTTVRVVTFAVWEQGLVIQRGNPKHIRSLADLGNRQIRLMNREKGSGSRDLLDAGLRAAGVRTEQVSGYDSIAEGHLAAAFAIARDIADCCIGPRSAARCFGLHFVPLAVERFDLCFSEDTLTLPATKAVLDVLQLSRLRNKLRGIAGYDTSHTGDVLV